MKKILCVQGGGIGNILQIMPAVGALIKDGRFYVDLLVNCNSSKDDFQVLKIPGLHNVFTNKPIEDYRWQLNGPHARKFKVLRDENKKIDWKRIRECKTNYKQNIEESSVFYDLVKEIGVKEPRQKIKLNLPKRGYTPPKGTIGIYPGCKTNWAMKQWDKWPDLCKRFKRVVLFGLHADIYQKHRTWFDNNFQWPDNAQIFQGGLSDVAYTISKCSCFIGNDGGTTHLAAATGIPTFIVSGPSCMIKNKPFGDNSFAIHTDLECQPCQFKTYTDLGMRPNHKIKKYALTPEAKKDQRVLEQGKFNCPFNMQCFRELTVDDVTQAVHLHLP